MSYTIEFNYYDDDRDVEYTFEISFSRCDRDSAIEIDQFVLLSATDHSFGGGWDLNLQFDCPGVVALWFQRRFVNCDSLRERVEAACLESFERREEAASEIIVHS